MATVMATMKQRVEKGLRQGLRRRLGQRLKPNFGSWTTGRKRPSRTLLVRPQAPGAPGDDNPLHWILVEGGRVVDGGCGEPSAEAKAALPAIFVVQGADVAYFDLPAPPGLKSAEWGLLLEEHLCAPAADLQIACVGRANGRLQLMATDAKLLEQWSDYCQTRTLAIERFVTDFQLLPALASGCYPSGCYLSWHHRNGVALIGPEQGTGGVAWLTLPTDLADSLPPAWAGLQHQVCAGEGGERDWWVLAPAALPLPVPLRGGQSRRVPTPRFARLLPSLKPLRPALAFLLAATGFYLVAWGIQSMGRYDSAREQVIERLQLDASAQPARAGSALDARIEHQRRQMDRLTDIALFSDSLGQWLEENPGWQLIDYRYRDGRAESVLLAAEGAVDGDPTLSGAIRERLIELISPPDPERIEVEMSDTDPLEPVRLQVRYLSVEEVSS